MEIPFEDKIITFFFFIESCYSRFCFSLDCLPEATSLYMCVVSILSLQDFLSL